MTELDAVSPEEPENPEPKPGPKSGPTSAEKRKEREAVSLRERLVREAQDEVTVAFDSYGELRQAVQAAVQSVEKALQQCMLLERKCGSPLGRRFFLGRRLFLKPTLGVLGTALHHLKKAGSQMDAASRLREGVLDEVADPGLDH